MSLNHNDNGDLTGAGVFKYTYDAWNRLVKVTTSVDADVTLQSPEFDAQEKVAGKNRCREGMALPPLLGPPGRSFLPP